MHCFNGLCYIFPLVPALTINNILQALRGTEARWNDIGLYLRLPRQTREEIRTQHSTDSDRLRAVILYVLTLHPQASWRCFINALHWMMEHQVAERIQDYSEPVTGMHIKDIATISCIVRLNTITVLVAMSHNVCVLSEHSILITIIISSNNSRPLIIWYPISTFRSYLYMEWIHIMLKFISK